MHSRWNPANQGAAARRSASLVGRPIDCRATGMALALHVPPTPLLAGALFMLLGCAPRDVHAPASEAPELPESVTITGMVVDPSGRPAAGREVWMKRAAFFRPKYFHASEFSSFHSELLPGFRVRTDDDGRFAVREVAPGPYWIGPAFEEGSRYAPLADFAWVEGDRGDVVVTLRPARPILGTVLDPAGAPAPNATVHATPDHAIASLYTKTDAAGAFRLQGLAEGRFVLYAELSRRDGISISPSKPLATVDGDTGARLRLRRGGAIRGRVVHADSRVEARAEVELFRSEELDAGWEAGAAVESGAFLFEDLAEGRYDCVARSEDGRIGVGPGVVVRAGSDADVRIRLGPAAKLVLGYDGTEDQASVHVLRGAASVALEGWIRKGTTAEVEVPPGELTVVARLYGSGAEERRTIHVAAGETAQASFRF